MSPISIGSLEGLTGRLIALGLIHAVWIGLVAAAVTAIVLQTWIRLSHRARHRLLLGALGVIVTGPIVAVVVQRSIPSSEPLPTGGSVRVELTRTDSEREPVAALPEQPPVSKPSRSIEGSFRFNRLLSAMIDRLEALQPFVLAAWLLGAVILSVRLILAGFAIRWMIRASEPAPATIQARADQFAHRLKLRRIPSVLVHPGLTEPGLCGFFRPKILLPANWLVDADEGRIDAILAHELAHAKRLDLPANLAQRLVEMALFFHPAVHWLSRSLRRERELCADSLAIRLTGDPISLALALESVARLRLTSSGRRQPSFGASLGGENFSLLPRIQELLGMTPTHPARRSLWPWISLPAAGLFALLGASLGLAQDPPKSAEPLADKSLKSTPAAGAHEPELKIGQVETASWPAQICYEIRFFSIGDPAWRDVGSGRMREVHRAGEVTAWMLDQKTTSDLVTSFQGDRRNDTLQAPNVTILDGKLGTINDKTHTHYVAELEKIVTPESVAFRPITKSVELGSQINIVGKIHQGSVLMDLDLNDTSLVAMHTRQTKASLKPSAKVSAENSTITGTYQIPALSSKRYRDVRNMPGGTSLLVSVGFEEKRVDLPPIMDRAIGLIRTIMGEPIDEADRVTIERLVLITPKVLVVPRELKPFTPKDQKKLSYFDAITTGTY